jgi:NTE family protein
MIASFETVFRRMENNTRNRLHSHAASGALKGFVLAYLGQQDARVPCPPADLVPREEVVEYPTDFSPMSEENIRLLSNRGEQVMRSLLAHYLPDL